MAGRQAVEFEEVVRRHQAMVFSIAYHLLHDRAAAEDVAQDVFLQLFRSMAQIESEEHAVFWLRRATVHRSIDRARQRDFRSELPLDDAPEPARLPRQSDPLLGRKLRELISSLPDRARAIVVLRYQEEMEPAEIAQVLAMPVGTVKSRLQRALAILREKMSRTVREVKK